MKTTLSMLLLMTSLAISSDIEAENTFLKGLYYRHSGQDSLACIFFSQTLKMDSSSYALKKLYAESLIKTGEIVNGIRYYRMVVTYYEQIDDWNNAFECCKIIFRNTKTRGDGNNLALALYYDGHISCDQEKIVAATKIWFLLMVEALKDNDIQTMSLIKKTRETTAQYLQNYKKKYKKLYNLSPIC